MKRILLLLGILLASTFITNAQDAPNCPFLEQEALTNTRNACFDLAPGEICFGSDTLSILQASENIGDLSQLGDRARLTDIQTWNVSSEDNTWGVASLNIQSYEENSWNPGEVTMLVFGNVQINSLGNENVTISTQDIAIDSPQGANIRVEPDTEYRVIQPVMQNDFVKATGRLSDASWIRVQLPDGQTGWVTSSASFADIDALPVTTANQPPPEKITLPMQVFELQSGIDDSRCSGAPPSGVLLQTTEGITSPPLIINGVTIRFSGTVFLQAQPLGVMLINMLEGEANVTAMGTTQFVPAAHFVDVSLGFDESNRLIPMDAPSLRQPYRYEDLLSVPVEYLPRTLYIALDLSTIITPRPATGGSPLDGMLVDALCTITVGPGGVNLRAGPGTNYPIQGVMDFRESAKPIGRTMMSDGGWWKLAEHVWLRVDTTVTGGDCFAIPSLDPPPPPRR